MSGALFYDHHADFAGHKPGAEDAGHKPWSPRKKLSCLLVCSAASWMIVLAPFLILA